MDIQQRASRHETVEELEQQLARLFPQAIITRIQCNVPDEPGNAESDPSQLSILLNQNGASVRCGCSLTLNRDFKEHEVRFAHFFERVFNEDVKSASRWARDDELWLSLQQTRLSRVIARFSPFHTAIFVRWLRAFENALSLRYEGQPFSTQLVLTKQKSWIKNNPAVDYVGFSDRMSLTNVLFEEKWTRTLAADGELSLVGLGHDRGVIGVMYVRPSTCSGAALIAPHTGLAGFCSVLVPGTLGLLVSPQGDLRVLMPNGATFVKSQGQWAMVNLSLLQETLATMLDAPIAAATTRLAADLSYEGHGALLCCIDNPGAITELIPDHSNKDRAGRSLRLMSRKLQMTQAGQREVLKRIATIDGAIVFTPDGRVLDAACMVSDPTDAKLASDGIVARQRFSGARSTAAWNASIHGIAIKISEDGPITVFKKGELILQL